MSARVYKYDLPPDEGVYEVSIPEDGEILCLVVEEGIPKLVLADYGGSGMLVQASVFLLDLIVDDAWREDLTLPESVAPLYTFKNVAESPDGLIRWGLLI